MRSAVVLLAGLLATVAHAAVTTGTCAAPVTPPGPVPVVTPTPFLARVNPAGLCPSAGCRGWGATYRTGADLLAKSVPVTPDANRADSVAIQATGFPTATQAAGQSWPAPNAWSAGAYTMNFNAVDLCGAVHKVPATLDYRCNNPPVLTVANSADQTVNVRLGAEVLLRATAVDPDSTNTNLETNALTFFWCLLSYPSAAGAPVATTTADVGPPSVLNSNTLPYIRVPKDLGATTAAEGPNFQEGLVLLKPTYSGLYTLSVTVTDGCNWVQQTVTVQANVKCCDHTARASAGAAAAGTGTILTPVGNAGITALTTTVNSATSTKSACLPPDYVFSSPVSAPMFYKKRYSPVYFNGMTTVTMDMPPLLTMPLPPFTPLGGCTWPGASNFKISAYYDDGSCTCAANVPSWDVMSAATSFVRKAATPAVVPVKSTGASNAVRFVTSLASTVTSPATTCGYSVTKLGTSPIAQTSMDIRTLTSTSTAVALMPMLTQPSTSWDATVTFATISNTTSMYSTSMTGVTTTTEGHTVCTVSVTAAETAGVSTVSVTPGAAYTYSQCLGYYSVMLSSTSASGDTCATSMDTEEVAVVCPYPPYVSILADVTLLWNGKAFVLDPSTAPTPATIAAFVGWVQIDARETPFVTNVAYSLTATMAPRMHSYLGASGLQGKPATNGPMYPFYDLAPYADMAYINGADPLGAAFLPSRGLPTAGVATAAGKYTITLAADDKCNTPTKDSVTINTMCLDISVPTFSISSAAAVTPGTAEQLTINGGYVASQAVAMTPPMTGPRQFLNWAVRVTARPMLPYGDVGVYMSTAATSPMGTAETSFECLLMNSWFAAAPTVGPFDAAAVTQSVNVGLAGGPYTLVATVLDGCTKTDSTSVTFTSAACPTASKVTAGSFAATTTVVFKNGVFPDVATTTLTGQTGSPTNAFFITTVPTGSMIVKNVGTVVGANIASPPTCVTGASPFNVGSTGAGGILRPAVAALKPAVAGGAFDQYAPKKSSTDSSYTFTPDAFGSYTVTLLAVGQCDYQQTTTSTMVSPNSAPRFLPNTVANGVVQTKSYWSTVDQRFATAYVSMLGDGGSDTPSDQDTITYTLTLATTSIKSWWSAAYVHSTAAFTLTVPEGTAGMWDDATSFMALESTVWTKFAAAVTASIPTVDSARIIGDNTMLPAYAVTMPAGVSLGVTLTPLCYVAGFGRTFTASVSFAVLPPKWFQSFGTVTGGATADARGYARIPGSGDGLMPLSEFHADLMLEAAAIAAATATTVVPASMLGPVSVPGYVAASISAPVSVANAYHFKASVLLALVSNVDANPIQTTSFLPDIDGTYTFSATIVDNCPGNNLVSPQPVWTATSKAVTVVAPTCELSGTTTALTMTQKNIGATIPLAAITRAWSSKAKRFGDAAATPALVPWTYTVISTDTANLYPAGVPVVPTPVGYCFTGTTVVTCPTPVSVSSLQFSFSASSTVGALAVLKLGSTATYGSSLSLTITPVGTIAAGGELVIGCASTGAAYTSPLLAGITYFHTIDTSFPGAGSSTITIVLPAVCRAFPGVDVVFYQAPSSSATGWAVTIEPNVHPAGFGGIASTFKLSGTFVPTLGALSLVPDTQSTTGSVAANTLGTQLVLTSDGLAAPLPASAGTAAGTSYTVKYTLSYTLPDWFAVATCSTASLASTSATLTCPRYSMPTLTPSYSSGFDILNGHYNAASVGVTISPISGATAVPVLATDLVFSFPVIKAPPGSVLDAATLLNSYLNAELIRLNPAAGKFPGTNAAGMPVYITATPPVVVPAAAAYPQCNTNMQTIAALPAMPLTSTINTFTSTITGAYAAYVNVSSMMIVLTPTNTGKATWAILDPANLNPQNAQYNEYVLKENGMTAFVPDMAGPYTIGATVDDGCNPQVVLTPTTVTAACTAPVLAFTSTSTGISETGAGRVQLSGTVDGVMWAMDDVKGQVRSITWAITSWPDSAAPASAPAPVLFDAASLYPSFIPSVAGDYMVSLTVDTGCKPLVPLVQKVTVLCNLAPAMLPSPSIAIAQAEYATAPSSTVLSSNTRRIGEGVTLTAPFLPMTINNGMNKFYWIGEPGCPTKSSPTWDLPTAASYTCPTATYAIAITAVYPQQLLTLSSALKQVVAITLSVGGVVGIPSGLFDPNYAQNEAALDPSILTVTIGGVACTGPMITNAAAGQIVCYAPTLSTAGPMMVKVMLNGVMTVVDFPVTVATTGTISSVTASSYSPLGGGMLTVSGWNLAFGKSVLSWSAVDSSVTIGGKACTALATSGADVYFTSQLSLTCTVPAGYGANLDVVVKMAFRSSTGVLDTRSSITSSMSFSYAAPMVTKLTQTGSDGLGGYWVMAEVTNLGWGYNTIDGMWAAMAPSVAVVKPYSDVMLMLGMKTLTSANMWSVVQAETATTPAMLKFTAPAGCGEQLDLTVARLNVMSAPTAAATAGVRFSYAKPVITCIGQPYVDPTVAGCTRVQIEGRNFGAPGAAYMTNVSFWSGSEWHGACDDVEYDAVGAYVRVSCRVPASAKPGDTISFANECGFSNGMMSSSGRALATAVEGLPSSVALSGCSQSYQVQPGQAFSYNITAPLLPTTSVGPVIQNVVIVQGTNVTANAGAAAAAALAAVDWKDRQLSNGLFIGLFLPALLIVVIGYPVYVIMQRKQAGKRL